VRPRDVAEELEQRRLPGARPARGAAADRWCVSSFPFGMDGALPVDQSVSCPGCSEVYPEEQRRAGGGTTTSWWILPAEHRDPCPRCYRAALNSPEPSSCRVVVTVSQRLHGESESWHHGV